VDPTLRALATAFLCGALACGGRDPAEREYFAALEAADRGAPLEEQLAHVERAIAIAPEPRADYFQMRAGYRASLGDLPGAEADYGRAIELSQQPYLRFQRANLIAHRGEPVRALADYDRAIAAQPENAQFYRGRALARAAAGRAAEALADAEHLMAKLPQQAETWHARGVARLALGQAREALADFDHTIGAQPELAFAWSSRAAARERLGDVQGAAADRAQAAKTAEEKSGCGYCLHPWH
jgi:tetratricopeptide (TPR) repeat protein